MPQNTPEIGYNQLRDAITERLGGPFDYSLYQEDLKDIVSEIDLIKREFRNQALLQPEFKDSTLHKVPEFDFTLPGVSPDSQFANGELAFQTPDVKVSHIKPQNLQKIETQAIYIIDCDPSEIEEAAKLTVANKKHTSSFQ